MGRLFKILFAVAAGVAGALAGRYVARLRHKPAHEFEAEAQGALSEPALRPRDVIPGLIAALRVHDRPWSYLHIPAWLAAFAVNFGLAAAGREFGPLASSLRGEEDGWGWRRPATRWTEARVVSGSAEDRDALTQ
ncbi:MAG: hypothetical protein R3B59_08465 [Dehalococcoidia bacterium]